MPGFEGRPAAAERSQLAPTAVAGGKFRAQTTRHCVVCACKNYAACRSGAAPSPAL